MKKRILGILFAVLLVCSLCFAFTACGDKDDNPDTPEGYETTVMLDSENYSDYLKVEGVVNNSGASLFPYSSLPSVKKSYIKPRMIVKVSPIDDTHIFNDTTITVSVNYVFRLWNTSPGSTNDFVGWEDIVTKEVTISIDSTGSGSTVIESSSASNKLYVCGFTSVYPTNVTGKVSVPCLHEWQDGETITPASCISTGTMSVNCTKCDKTKEKSIDALGHDLPTTPTSSTPATCTSAGSETYSCERCGESETKTIDALGHTYNEAEAITTPATCTNAGKVDYTCTRCGSVNSDVIDALGHSFTNYTTTDATCTSNSYKTAKCDRCEEIDTITNEDTALGHNYGEDGKCTRCSTINPNLKVTSLEISNDSFLLEAGKATQVKFAVYPSDAIYEKVTYRIYQNNTCDATLSETGLLTCGKVGSVTIAVTIDDEITARATFYVPQMITTAEEFFNIRNDLGGVYMLANDIDLSGYANWTPIGNATKSSSGNYDYTNAFSGKFDGGGYTISGLNINLSDSSCSSLLTVGLFGSLSRDGQVSNVVLKDVKVTGTSNATDYVGMLVGFNPGSVNDCNVTGMMTVSGATYIGGVIGENIGSAEKISSNVAITVTGSKNYLVGGITGRTTGGQLSDVSVLGSINVTSSASVYVGGVAGNLVDKLITASADVDITVKTTSSSSSYNYVGIIAGASSQSLSDITADGSITVESYSNAYVGGIVGYSDANISKCINNASIALTVTNSSSTASYVGGILGFTSKDVDDCENNGTVSATQFYGGYVGGIVGNSGAVTNCENNADVYAKSTSKTVYCGGVIGYAKSVDSCTNNAKVNALVYASNANYVGGVVGYSEGAISNSINNQNGELVINYSSSTSSSSAYQYFGGVGGYAKSTVSDSTNYANVSAYSNGVGYCGGVIGYANGNVNKVNNYGYSLTITSGSTNSSYSNYVGGIAGYINGTLTTAYNTATISVTKGNVAVGGVAGYVNSSTTSAKSTANITVNNTVSGQDVVTYVGGVIGNTPSSVTSSAATNSNIEVNSKNKVYVGGVVGNCGGTITECYAYPNITVANSYVTYTGGVSGYAKKIVKSYSTSNIVSNTLGSYDLYVGGLSGYISTGAEESYATGDVSGTASSKVYMAGLVGYVGNGATVTNCYVSNGYIKTNSSSFSSSLSILIYNGGLVGYNDGTISYSYAVNYGYTVSYGSSNSHSHYIGGLVAYNNGTISSSYVLDATDKLARTGLEINRDVVGSGTAKSFYAGGIVGYNQGTVSNCYSDATVNTTVSGAYTGGFVGFNNATIKNSIAYGEVNSGITGDTTGGFAGGGTSGYTSCFFSKDTTLQTTSVGSATQSGITASTNANLRTAATFSGFSSTYWNIVDGTYPALIFGSVWESRSDGFNKYNMLVNVPNKDNQYQFPHSNRVTVSFESNGGEIISPITVSKNDIISLPKLSNYVANGLSYVFVGWFADEELTDVVSDASLVVSNNMTLYAYYCKKVEKPVSKEYVYNGETISVSDVFIDTEAYTVSGDFQGKMAGVYTITLKLNKGYCWDDETQKEIVVNWYIINAPVIKYDLNIKAIKLSDAISPELFDAVGMDGFGNDVAVVAEIAKGEQVAGNTLTVRLSAIVNNHEAIVTLEVKVYGTPSITLNQDNYSICVDTELDTLFDAYDSFNDKLDINIITNDLIIENSFVNLTVTATDSVGNFVEQQYRFAVKPVSGSYVELYINNEFYSSLIINDNADYVLPIPNINGKNFYGWYDEESQEYYTYSNGKGIHPISGDEKLQAVLYNEDAILISNESELQSITLDMKGKYVLVNNIDILGLEWVSLGSESNPFTGVFDGNGFSILNLTQNSSSQNLYSGLFACNNGIIKNLTVTNALISSTGSYSGVISSFNNGQINNCYVDGKLENIYSKSASSTSSSNKVYNYTGGIVGYNTGNIIGCSSKVNITASCTAINNYSYAYSYVGGICGYNAHGIIDQCTIIDNLIISQSESKNSYRDNHSYAGGVSGYNYFGEISNCYITGSVIAKSFGNRSAYSESLSCAGGVVGMNDQGTIKNCICLSNSISAESEFLYGDELRWGVKDCYSYSGGICGKNSSGNITGCCSIANISSSAISEYVGTTDRDICDHETFAGGIVGYSSNANLIVNCYSSSEQTFEVICQEKKTYSATNNYGMQTQTETLKTIELYINTMNWSKDIWNIVKDNYPTLK